MFEKGKTYLLSYFIKKHWFLK